MNSVITNDGKFSGGYFVLNKLATNQLFSEGDGFAVTCKKTKGLLNSILKLISEAQNYIKICSFIIDNRLVVDSLKDQLKEGKISIFILTAVDDKKIKSDILDEDEGEELSKSRHFEFIDELVKAGAHVRASSNAHAKFVIKDGSESLLMSANLTEPSLNNNEKGKDPNDESGIFLAEKNEVNCLERIFDAIFLYGTEFRKFINLKDRTQLISKHEKEIRKSDFPDINSKLLWSYEDFYQLIYEKLNSFIAAGQNSIKLSTYSIVELNNLSELVESLKTFLTEKKGNVNIFCRAMNHRPDHLNACKQLAEIGIKVYGDMFNHSKGISIDDNHGIIFTANIDGKHGLKNGFEVGYVIEESNKSFANFNSFLDYQIQSAPFMFSLSPSKKDVYEFYQFWYKEKETKITVKIPESFELKFRSNSFYAKEFEEGISKFPIFYTPLNKQNKKEIQFEISGKTYLVDILNDTTFLVTKQLSRSEIVNAEKYLLFYNKINLTGYES